MSNPDDFRWVGEQGPELRVITGGDRVYSSEVPSDMLKLADEWAAQRHRDEPPPVETDTP